MASQRPLHLNVLTRWAGGHVFEFYRGISDDPQYLALIPVLAIWLSVEGVTFMLTAIVRFKLK